MSEAFETALLMIASTRAALKNGVRHFDKSGNLLETELAIMGALQRDGEIVFDTTARQQRTTDEIELAAVRREYGIEV